MNVRLVAIIYILLAVPLLAADSQELRRESRYNGKDLVWRVAREALRAVPAWDPARQEPPLAISAAAKIAQVQANPRFPSHAIVIGIELSAVREQGNLRWYYFIRTYNQDEANGPTPPQPHEVLILMNGKVINPSEEPPRVSG